jgi:hypothetical protein
VINKLKIFLVFFSLLIGTQILDAQSDKASNVLFVGNSYTYFWNLPQVVSAMAEERGLQITSRQSTAGGANWGQHWRSEKGLESVALIDKGDFDIVILQNHSMSTFQRADSLMHFGKLFDNLIQKKNAKTYIYLTWSREWDPYMQEEINEKYAQLAEEIKATLVPVGPAWLKARQLRPDLPLYDDDGSHPSSLGTYLAACIFFGVLTDESPVGLPGRIVTTDKDGEKLYLSIQSDANALFCQKVAEEILMKYLPNKMNSK